MLIVQSHTYTRNRLNGLTMGLSSPATTSKSHTHTIRMSLVSRLSYISQRSETESAEFQRVHTIVMLMQISISCFKLLLYSLLLTVWKRRCHSICRKNPTKNITVTMGILCDIMCIRCAVHPDFPSFSVVCMER